MSMVLIVSAALLSLAAASLAIWRRSDSRADDRAWIALLPDFRGAPALFDRALVADLPEAARRYFEFTIATGTALSPTVVLEMEGRLGLGDKQDPKYRDFRARQILSFPHGFLWRLDAGLVGGSDGLVLGRSWTRFWVAGLAPVARISDDRDHFRSAFGRMVAEAAFWAPASLLPGKQVKWEDAGPDTARAIVSSGEFDQAVEIALGPDGQPTAVTIQRWSSANPDKSYRFQPFGGTLSHFRDFGGYRIPTRVEGGNHFGTADYFPFFKARIVSGRFVVPNSGPVLPF